MDKKAKFNEDFIKRDAGYFLEVDVEYPKNCLIFIAISRFYLKEWKSENHIFIFHTAFV